LQVASQVPLPSGLAFTFAISFSSGRHPVWPALTSFNCLTITGELVAIETQPAMIDNTATNTLIRMPARCSCRRTPH
jgi:hypothetical protein